MNWSRAANWGDPFRVRARCLYAPTPICCLSPPRRSEQVRTRDPKKYGWHCAQMWTGAVNGFKFEPEALASKVRDLCPRLLAARNSCARSGPPAEAVAHGRVDGADQHVPLDRLEEHGVHPEILLDLVRPVRGDEDDRRIPPESTQRVAKLGPAHAGHPHVDHEAVLSPWWRSLQECRPRLERLDAEAGGDQEASESAANRMIVVDHKHAAAARCHCAKVSTTVRGKDMHTKSHVARPARPGSGRRAGTAGRDAVQGAPAALLSGGAAVR